MRRAARSSVSRQWLFGQYEASLGSSGVGEDLAVLEDVITQPGVPGRLLRVIGTCMWRGGAATAAAHVSLGLVRVPVQMTNTPSPLTASDADMSWVYREMWSVQYGSLTGAGTGVSDGRMFRFDWQLRDGKGTRIEKDVSLRIVAGYLNPLNMSGSTTWTVDAALMFLLEDV